MKGVDATQANAEIAAPSPCLAGRMARNDRSRGVQRGATPLRSFSSPFPKGGFRGIGPGDEAEVGTARRAVWIPAFAGMTGSAATLTL